MKIYDLVIIGSGPAGMSAAIYAQRAMLDFVMIEKEYMPGGQVVQTYEVDNYPGIPKTNGMDLGLKFSEHAKELGAKSITAEVKEIYADEEIKEIMLKNGDTLKTRTIILATGAVHQTLGIEGEEKLKGMGVSYCATCDGAFFRNKVTAVVGGGNVALEDAIFLSRMCKKVYLIHRRDEFRGAKILQDEVTILAEIAEWPDEIDVNRANEAKIRAERRLETQDPNININRAEIALKKSLVRIEVGKL